MAFLQSVDILGVCVVLLHILCMFVYSMDTCSEVTFHRRSEMDDLMFTGSLIEEMKQVDMRAECFPRCHWRILCNLVLYNPLTNTCRLHSEVFDSTGEGISESGWQYYGVACDNYRLANSQENVDVIANDIGAICNSSYFTVDSNTSSCFRGASWKTVKKKCIPCDNGTTQQSMDPTTSLKEDLEFDIEAGMTLRLRMSGSRTHFNHVWLMDANQDTVFLLSLRWDFPTVGEFKMVFNSRQANVWGNEFRTDFTANSSDNYVVEIVIRETSILTYVDGTLWMTSPIRFSLSGIRHIEFDGLTALHEFSIGKGMCK